MRRRGAARVLGIYTDALYLAQARFAAEVLDVGGVEFRQMRVYDVAALGERFDLVVFMGVLYHLRHPLLALDAGPWLVVDRVGAPGEAPDCEVVDISHWHLETSG